MKKTLVIEGIIFIALGTLAVIFPHISTVALELLLGWILILSGVFQIYAVLRKKTSLPVLQSFLLAAAYTLVGVLLLLYPKEGMVSITAFLMALFLLQGVYGVFMAFHTSFPPISKAWLFVSGLISFTFAFLIWHSWPQDSSWITGLFTGANLILLGIAYLVLGKFFRKI